MWIKVGHEYLNLDHVVRIRFVKTWKNGQDDLGAELEAFVGKGELQVFCRYRGHEAKDLHAIFVENTAGKPSTAAAEATALDMSVSQASTSTVHDICLPAG